METNVIQILSFLTNVVMMVIGVLIMLTLWKVVGIMGEMNDRIKKAETQIKEFQNDMKSFAVELDPVKITGLISEIYYRMKDAETQIKELHSEANAFAQKLNPFFAGGQELIEDILKSKRAADEAHTQTPTE